MNFNDPIESRHKDIFTLMLEPEKMPNLVSLYTGYVIQETWMFQGFQPFTGTPENSNS